MAACFVAAADQTNYPVWLTATQWNNGSVNMGIICSNLPQPAQFQPRDTGTTTNIVISEQYHGTIQIGTNFYTRTDFDSRARKTSNKSKSKP